MSLVEVLLLAFALSIDASVVSFSYGIKGVKTPVKSALSLALFTGFFQGFMPYLGGICTNCVESFIQPYAKWIVFAIFLYLGISFIKEALTKGCDDIKSDLTIPTLFLIAIATSIDAFSAGISLSLRLNCIIMPVIIIGVITFINSLIGFFVGSTFKNLSTKYLEILGGCILIALALKVIL